MSGRMMGSQLAPRRDAKAGGQQSRDPEYAARLEFATACLDMARLNGHFAAVGEPSLSTSDIAAALDATLPVLASIADRLEVESETSQKWNIMAAGRNEIILQQVERNWCLLEKLAPDLGHA